MTPRSDAGAPPHPPRRLRALLVGVVLAGALALVLFVGLGTSTTNGSAFVRRSGITYPVGGDNDLRVTASLYGLNAEPQTFFIEGSGSVVGHHYGALSKSELDRWIHLLVAGH